MAFRFISFCNGPASVDVMVPVCELSEGYALIIRRKLPLVAYPDAITDPFSQKIRQQCILKDPAAAGDGTHVMQSGDVAYQAHKRLMEPGGNASGLHACPDISEDRGHECRRGDLP
jgi:hypothetical protein